MCLCALHTSSFCSFLAVTNNMFCQARRCCIGKVSSLPSHFRFKSPFNTDQMWPWPLLASMLSIMRPCNDHDKARCWCTTVHIIQLWHIVLLAFTPPPPHPHPLAPPPLMHPIALSCAMGCAPTFARGFKCYNSITSPVSGSDCPSGPGSMSADFLRSFFEFIAIYSATS